MLIISYLQINFNIFLETLVVKDKERISFEYDAFESRATMYYGNTDLEKQKRRYVKHYRWYYGKPSESNEYFWNYFYENYGK